MGLSLSHGLPCEKKEKDTELIFSILFDKTGAEGQNFSRLWRSNCRNGDFQTKFLKIQKCYNYKHLILFQFSSQLLVSFGTVWKYLTLTGTIWAQSVIIIDLILS